MRLRRWKVTHTHFPTSKGDVYFSCVMSRHFTQRAAERAGDRLAERVFDGPATGEMVGVGPA